MRNLCQDLIVLYGFSGAVNWTVMILGHKLIAEEVSLHFAFFILVIFGSTAWEEC